jgi:hypothetical protein
LTTATGDVGALRAALGHLEIWSRLVLGRPLRPYQLEPAAAILRSIAHGRGDAITVMMSRQAGKNELSAHVESFLLVNRQRRMETLVKAAPTFKPQTINSILRLTTLLDNPMTAGRWARPAEGPAARRATRAGWTVLPRARPAPAPCALRRGVLCCGPR